MVQVAGVTYRIERLAPHSYSVVRLMDDIEVGTFRTRPQLRIQMVRIELDAFRDVVRAALRSARTSAVMQAAPAFEPDEDKPPSARSPSDVPPRTALA
jgi:hypothetical protein